MKEHIRGTGTGVSTSDSDPDPDPENTMDFVYTENTSLTGSTASSLVNVDIPSPTPERNFLSVTNTAPRHASSRFPQNAENRDEDPPIPSSDETTENDTVAPDTVAKEMSELPVLAIKSSEIITMSVEKTRYPTPAKSTIPLRGPGLLALASAPDAQALKSAVCPRCGLKIDAADTKMIPKERVWFLFMCLFFCLCWWISWIPFLCKRWYKPVEICPHCYRRIDRPHVGSDSVDAHP